MVLSDFTRMAGKGFSPSADLLHRSPSVPGNVGTLLHLSGLAPAHAVAGFGASTAAEVSVALGCVFVALGWSLVLTSRSLAQARLLFEAVFDSMGDGVIVLDCDRNISRTNRAGITLFGGYGSSFLQHPLHGNSDVYDSTGQLLPYHLWPSVLASEGTFVTDMELTIHRKDVGKIVIVQVNTSAIGPCPRGKPSRVMIHYRDITESRQSDVVRRRLAAIVDSSEDAIIGKDLNGVITTWNLGAEKIFGYSSGEILGRPITLLLPFEQLEEEEEIMRRIRAGDTVTNADTVRQRKDGQLIHVSLTISPIRDTRGVIIGASKIARDITQTHLLQRQLHQSQKMEAIGQLTGGIAHDFNNLLAIIIGNLDLLQAMPDANETALHRIDIARKAASRGADLTRRLLSFASQEQLNPAPTLLEDSIHNMTSMVARALGPTIKITNSYTSPTPPVFVDPAGLESALLNLAVNARDAMPKGGILAISTHLSYLDQRYVGVQTGEITPGTYACISVSDTGEGMSKETLDRVFEPFFTTKALGKGTGLGLPMVYGFVRQSGGSIRIYSEPGAGTTVLLYLPLAEIGPDTELELAERYEQRALAEQSSPTDPHILRPPQHGTVLLVDDEADLVEIGTAYLSELGFTVLTAANAAEALEIAALHHEIDLLVTDIIMPGMNGTELSHALHARRPNIRVIYSSGFTANALAERNVDLVGIPLLRKPFRRAEFAALVFDVLRASVTPPLSPLSLFLRREGKSTPPPPKPFPDINLRQNTPG